MGLRREVLGVGRGEMLKEGRKEGVGVLISEDVYLRDVPVELRIDDM